jgi:hypothetical protein
MAAPTVGALGANLSSASGTSAAVAAPGGVVSGAVVAVGIFLDGSAQTITPPAGWAYAENTPVDVSGGSHGLHVFWHRASGSEAGPYTFTWSSSTFRSGFAVRIDNVVASGTPFDSPTGVAQDNTNSTTTPAVSTTSLGPERLDGFFGTNWSGGNWTAPSGFTKHQEGAEQVIVFCSKSHPTEGSTGSLTATCTGSDKRTAFVGALIGTTSGGASSLIIPRRPRIGALLDL